MLEVAETIWAELICCMLCNAFSLWAASRYEWGPWPGTCNIFNQISLNCTGWSHNTKSGQGTQRTAGFKGFRFESSISYPAMILYGFSLGASTTLIFGTYPMLVKPFFTEARQVGLKNSPNSNTGWTF